MPRKLFFVAVLAVVLISTGSTLVFAQSRSLELETSDGLLVIPLSDGSVLDILADGDVAATADDSFACTAQSGTCADVEVSMNQNVGGSFSLNRSEVSQGQNFQATWGSRGAWECVGSGMPGSAWNNNNPKAPSGNQSVSTTGVTPDEYELELTCRNGPVSDTRTASITVLDASTTPTTSECSGVTELSEFSGWSQATDARPTFGSNESQVFSGFFGQWPGTNNNNPIGVRKNQYVSLAFTTGTLTSSSGGQFNREQIPPLYENEVGPGRLILSFSTCPGDFDPASDANVCVGEFPSNIFVPRWGGPGSGLSCELQSNTDYYLNILYATSPIGVFPPVQDDCFGKPRCGSNWRASGIE